MARTGRPLKLDDPARTRPDGTIVTIAEAIITAVSLGQDFTAASKGAGISSVTLHSWRLTGARARTQQIKGLKITDNDRRLIEFLNALEKAEAEAELERLAIIHRASQPHQVVKIVEKVDPTQTGPDGQPKVLERTTTTETRPGLWTPAAWWLERRIPSKYARRLELTGADGAQLIPPADRARSLAESLVEFQNATAESGEADDAAEQVRASRVKRKG